MKKFLICLALLGPGLPLLAGNALPRDVQKFIDRREGCDHMRGEVPDPGDKHQAKQVNHEIEKLCKGTDKQLAQLKKKYASNGLATQSLNEFEEGIEAPVALVSTQKPAHKTK